MPWSVQVRFLGRLVKVMRRDDLGSEDQVEPGASRQVTETVVKEWLQTNATAVNEMARHTRTSGSPSISKKVYEGFRNGELVILAWKRPAATTTEGQKPAPAPPPPTATPPPEEIEKTWFRAQLFDEEGQVMANEDYILDDSNGTHRTGKLDNQGIVYIPKILNPGDCKISFPNIHLNPRKRKK